MAEPVASVRPIAEIGSTLGFTGDDIEPRGHLKAKLRVPDPLPPARGKLILVTAMTPARSGSGKTVTSIALGQAFGILGISHCLALREPSLGPTLGIKGGGAGGGRATLVPMEDINLHFTGDLHAVTSAHNLLSAMVDNHVYFDNPLAMDPARITWPRVLDLCDRQLRHVQLGLGDAADGFAHPGRFDITAASEVMAVAALAQSPEDLRARLSAMVVGYDRAGKPVSAAPFGAVNAMDVLLQDAMRPNLVQTSEGTPALVHMGPFANIAHGCNSVIATRLALAHADYVVTEAGFGADLGAEKFIHIKCRQAGIAPAASVLVVTANALRKHGGARKGTLMTPNPEAVARGMDNARVHVENLAKLGVPCVVALNRFPVDTDAELDAIRRACDQLRVPFVVSDGYARGGQGALQLAKAVKALADSTVPELRPLYDHNIPLADKIDLLARELYRADGVDFSSEAQQGLARLQADGHGDLAICMAKTPLSLSDDPNLRGVPKGHRVHVRDVSLRAGARFVVALTGETLTMPGMPRHGAAERLRRASDGTIEGLF